MIGYVTEKKLLLCIVFGGTDRTIETEQIQTRKSDQCVDDSGNPAHASEKESNQIQIEKTDQSPVNSSDDGNRQCRIS